MTDQQPTQPPPYSGPPPPGNVPVTSQPTSYVVYTGHGTVVPVMIQNTMGYEPCYYTCKSCNLKSMTRVERRPGCRTHTFAALLCLFGCWPCVCFPYCVHSCNNADHFCPHCGSYMGSYLG